MADIGIANCRVHYNHAGGYSEALIITPNTADSNDTVDISGIVTDGDLCLVSAWDIESQDTATCTADTSGVLTIDAAGGTTNHTYAIKITWVSYSIPA